MILLTNNPYTHITVGIGSSQRVNHFVQLYVDPARQSGFYPIPEDFWFDSEVLKIHPINNLVIQIHYNYIYTFSCNRKKLIFSNYNFTFCN